ncbi:MAG TPA: tetratricopeptide repeat protein, partial [Anseongella sp.]|nr:tetratricopeptide repeat protein [Anseongella sp.]
MRRSALLLFVVILLAACNESESDNVLSALPFKPLTDSIRQAPSDAGLYSRRGRLLYANDQKDLAEKDLRKAWELQPSDEANALDLTRLLMGKHPDSAFVFLQQALRNIPKSIALRIGLARGYQLKQQPDKALAICDEIIREYPGQLDALALKAELLDEKAPEDAISTLEKAYAFAPDDVELVHRLAFRYAEDGNPKVLSLADSLI